MLSRHVAFGWLDESKMDAFVMQAGVFLQHCRRAVPHQTKNIVNLLGKVRESLEFWDHFVHVRKKQRHNMFGTMSNSNTRIENSQNLASILDITRSIKKTRSMIPEDFLLCTSSSDSISSMSGMIIFAMCIASFSPPLERWSVQSAISSKANELFTPAARTFTSGQS